MAVVLGSCAAIADAAWSRAAEPKIRCGQSTISQKKWAGRIRPLDSFLGEERNCIRSPRQASDKSRGCQEAAAPGLRARIRRPSPWSTRMGFLAGKRFLITGVLSNRSIAYGIARACQREGAELAFSYQGERFKERIGEFAAEFGSTAGLRLRRRRRRADRARCSRGLGEAWPKLRRLRALDRLRAARGDRRRLPRRPVARGLPHRARHLELQLPGDGQGGARRC